MSTTNHINLNRFLSVAGGCLTLHWREYEARGPDLDKGKAASAQGSPWHQLRQPPYRQRLPHVVLQRGWGGEHRWQQVAREVPGCAGSWRRQNRSPYIAAGAVPGGVAVATAPNAASRVEKAMRHHLIGPDSRSISKSLTSLTPMSGEHMAASPLVVVSEWEWNQAPLFIGEFGSVLQIYHYFKANYWYYLDLI
jgi:hypothetical protein